VPAPQERNIAQVFQFPVIYDTMTVAENLAFPLRNRKMPESQIRERVGTIAEMLELSGQLDQRAAGLAADAKQKISLGRGLVRPDVAAVLFDEPLTVIDPHLKWKLRRKLKQIHHELKLTLIYVTHDQVEALTFADEVVVMTRGRAVQVGAADALFERPPARFVGHFIGSPGMNFLSAQHRGRAPAIGGPCARRIAATEPARWPAPGGRAPGIPRLTAPDAPGALPCSVVARAGYWHLFPADGASGWAGLACPSGSGNHGAFGGRDRLVAGSRRTHLLLSKRGVAGMSAAPVRPKQARAAVRSTEVIQ
jgi:glycerol transport system ATP-binding protein